MALAPAATGPAGAALIDEIIRRIVQTANPLRVVLFGSAARETMTEQSDIDVLVVVPEGVPIRPTAQELHVQMTGVTVPVDIVVAAPSMLERYGNSHGLIYREALRHGREVYAA